MEIAVSCLANPSCLVHGQGANAAVAKTTAFRSLAVQWHVAELALLLELVQRRGAELTARLDDVGDNGRVLALDGFEVLFHQVVDGRVLRADDGFDGFFCEDVVQWWLDEGGEGRDFFA